MPAMKPNALLKQRGDKGLQLLQAPAIQSFLFTTKRIHPQHIKYMYGATRVSQKGRSPKAQCLHCIPTNTKHARVNNKLVAGAPPNLRWGAIRLVTVAATFCALFLGACNSVTGCSPALFLENTSRCANADARALGHGKAFLFMPYESPMTALSLPRLGKMAEEAQG